MRERHTLIIGVGNAAHGDDCAGLEVAARLQERLKDRDSVSVTKHWGEATALAESVTGWDEVLIIDAACSGAAPGSYRTFEVGETALPSDLAAMSSHGFGVAQAIELSRALDTLPEHCRVYAIEGVTFEAGAPLSHTVQQAVEAVAKEIVQSLEAVDA